MTPNPQDINQLRERLRGLGYLDAPVDRYVLGSAASRGGMLRFALGAGLRVGIVAGLLLGVSATVALAARAPGLISGRRDAAVLGVMLSLLFAMVTAAAVAATALVASWYARRAPQLTASRARGVAAVAGIAVALASAAYLTLWWKTAQELFTGMPLAGNAIALALAAGIALLVAHAVSLVILAALARSDAATDISAGGLLSSRAFLIVFGALLFAGSAALLAVGNRPDRAASSAQPVTVAPTGYALRVIAIDGLDIRVADRLRKNGPALPALSRFLDSAHLPLRRTTSATPDPARDWTTIATGQPPEAHGIAALEGRRAIGLEGRLPQTQRAAFRSLLNAADLLRLTTPAIASGEERRAPAFWEVAAAAGLRTAVINWWATWPAPAANDVVVTDRALLRLDTGGALDAELAPAALYDTLRAGWSDVRKVAASAAASAFESIANQDLRRVLVRSAEIDLLVTHIASHLEGPPLDLLVVYLPGLDIAQHQLLQATAPSTVTAMSERIAAIEAYYRFLDRVVQTLAPPSRSHIDAAILWPGRAPGADGAMMLAGDPIVASTVCEDCEIGAAGTLLYLLGLPIAEDLRSTPQTSLVSPAFLAAHPLRRIANYDGVQRRGQRGGRTGQPLDAEALERLRSLGYIR